MSPAVLGYWNVRGLAQPIRLLLHYVNENYHDKRYDVGPAPDFKCDQWQKDKASLGLDFPNLPYYVDGDIKMTQSSTILRYIGRKYKLMGESEMEKVLVDMMENISTDFRNSAIRFFYNSAFETLKSNYLKELQGKLQQFDKYLKGKKWFAGEKITIVDFPMYELLDQHRVLDETCLEGFPNLKKFMDNFESLPSIKSYMESKDFIKAPINNKTAKFGADSSDSTAVIVET